MLVVPGWNEPAWACDSRQYQMTGAVYNRQGVTNRSNPSRLWFYQNHKVGKTGATAGGWATGATGLGYCGSTFYPSTSSKL